MPGRKGCVLEGRVVVSEELEQKIKDLDNEIAERVRLRKERA